MKQNLVALIILELILPGIVTAAESVYQWTDDEGQIHYGDKLPASAKTRTIILQRETVQASGHSGLRQGEYDRLRQMDQYQRQQHRSAQAARNRTDRQRAAKRASCTDHREMLKNSRGRDTFKKHARYLRNNCW